MNRGFPMNLSGVFYNFAVEIELIFTQIWLDYLHTFTFLKEFLPQVSMVVSISL